MLRSRIAVPLIVSLVLAASAFTSAVPPAARAQEPDGPPALGTVVLKDALTGTGPFRPRACPTNRNASDFVEDGFQIRVTGRCTDAATGVVQGITATGLSVANGEIAVDVKVT
jgi:hypothetical protein